jgi:hypothetical protein
MPHSIAPLQAHFCRKITYYRARAITPDYVHYSGDR